MIKEVGFRRNAENGLNIFLLIGREVVLTQEWILQR